MRGRAEHHCSSGLPPSTRPSRVTDRLGSLLGTDGLCDHWRPVRRDPLTLLFPLPLYVAWFASKSRARSPSQVSEPGSPLPPSSDIINPHSPDEAGILRADATILGQNSVACGGPRGAAMGDPTGEADRGALRLDFERAPGAAISRFRDRLRCRVATLSRVG